MRVLVPREDRAPDRRVHFLPDAVERLSRLGAEVSVESGLGLPLRISDEEYRERGSKIIQDRDGAFTEADLVIRFRKPSISDVSPLKSGAIHLSFLDPFNEPDLVRALAQSNISAISLELLPRTTLAQKMDVLSSQSNLSGYVAVLLAAQCLEKIFPMMMTPAGTLQPAKVFIIGVGVAGLQAIATAKRLGARVEAFDTRPVVEEQVKSLGARFVKADLGETGQTKDGYAKPLTPDQLQKQRDVMARHCAQSDIVITTAQVFGRKAPVIVTKDMVGAMRPGSVIVDTAVETGGNVEGSKLDELVEIGGVSVIGYSNLASRVPVHASQMLSSNLLSFAEHFWSEASKSFELRLEDEIMRGSLVTHAGLVQNEAVRKALNL